MRKDNRPALASVLAAAALITAIAVVSLSGVTLGASPDDVKCLALTVYWEAREEGRDGMMAVGWVVLNRTRDGKYPDTTCGVVRQGGASAPCQFSYWCDGKSDVPDEGPSWVLARTVAEELLSDPPSDPTGGALLFHRDDVRPAWSREHRRTARVGRHIYYR